MKGWILKTSLNDSDKQVLGSYNEAVSVVATSQISIIIVLSTAPGSIFLWARLIFMSKVAVMLPTF